MTSIYAKKITVEIVSKGRKYFKVRYPGKSEFQMAINEISKDFQPGMIVTDLLCEFEYQHGYKGGGKTTVIPITSEELATKEAIAREAIKKAAIKKWQGYFETALEEGRIYTKGYQELAALGFDLSIYDEKIKEVKTANTLADIKRWLGYVEEKAPNYLYQKGVSEAKRLRIDKYPELLKRMEEAIASVYGKSAEKLGVKIPVEQSAKPTAEEIAAKEAKKLAIKLKAEAEAKAKLEAEYGVGAIQQTTSKSWKIGREIEYKNNQYIVRALISSEDYWESEDGLGGTGTPPSSVTNNEYVHYWTEYVYALSPATEADLTRIAEQKRIANEPKVLKDLIINHPQVTQPKHNAGTLLLSTVTPYGGGDWFEINEAAGEIWYCKNNGNDGDYWGDNNVTTWGAGAIGWRIPFDREIANRINALLPK